MGKFLYNVISMKSIKFYVELESQSYLFQMDLKIPKIKQVVYGGSFTLYPLRLSHFHNFLQQYVLFVLKYYVSTIHFIYINCDVSLETRLHKSNL
jgi:hypothetical protein